MWGRQRLRKEAMMGHKRVLEREGKKAKNLISLRYKCKCQDVSGEDGPQSSLGSSTSSGCLGSLCKQELTNSNEPPKRPKLQGRRVSKPSISEDFWTTSACDMDNSAVLSRGSISSISTSTLPIDPHGTSSGNTPSEFVNHGKFLLSFMLLTLFVLLLQHVSKLMLNMVGVGLLLWNQTRQQWIGTKKPNIHTQQLREPKISWNATYESLLGSNKPFSQRIPLSEMIDFLTDIWEQEGLYD
ncbi:hypothetical protein RHSIM_Rhsim12G0192000 [Rhododendron simsii]|uniref:Gag1-like clamp domain-containing protein n=1 Tax=Rhododendron simsii TaxID=118357 RepID=A0A834G5K5_RHOSS|nr:hypothetical protein RHSIM_Rhsim12G0192000 [Rhododendron simsii]